MALKRSAVRLRFTMAALALCGGAAVAAVEAGPNFTEAQAARGRTVYVQACASCHGGALEGGAGPALKGVNFSRTWGSGEHTIGQLHAALTIMPLGLPNSLPKERYLELLAFILSSNGYSSGGIALTPADFDLPLPPVRRVEAAPVVNAGDGEEADGPRKPAAGFPRLVSSAPGPTAAKPSDRDLQRPADGDWLMYNRDYRGQRFSPLDQI
ncbi:MAG: c-type cytochrome, partial [Sphingomonadales bacterium]|nr:c-type cytochrome [Sphingomonadales bacterium]